MPITQIPFQDPVAPPEKPQPEQLGLYDSDDWEEAYRDQDANAHVPHLVIQLQDDLARSRKREAVWISIIIHLVVFIILWNAKLIGRYMPWHSAIVVPFNANKDKDVTFLALPPDLQKAPRKPNTNVMSDKDRIATSRHPELDPKQLKKILATPPPGAPGPSGLRAAQPAAPAITNQPATQAGPQQQIARPQPEQTAQMHLPARPDTRSIFNKYGSGGTAGSEIQQAAHAAAANHGGGGQQGDFGFGTDPHGRAIGPAEILSDTQGVDFGPYIQRILFDIKENWYSVIPPSAEMKKGKLAVDFVISKDGHIRVSDPILMATSGDMALDTPAMTSIKMSNPFPPLPAEFTGPNLALRIRFYYCGEMVASQCLSGAQ
jgi:hypothetical protein